MSTIMLVVEKVGMTGVYQENGQRTPVTVLKVPDQYIAQIKTVATDGYSAAQLAYGTQKASRLDRATSGHLVKAKVSPARGLKEFRVTAAEAEQCQLGQAVSLETIQPGMLVDLTGLTKGRGFSGSVRRHNFGTQPNSHGCSLSHRVVGSTGQNQSPGRVFKGKKMPGRYGQEQVTVLNLEVVKVCLERKLLIVKGAVPGAPGTCLTVRKAVRSHGNRRVVAESKEVAV